MKGENVGSDVNEDVNERNESEVEEGEIMRTEMRLLDSSSNDDAMSAEGAKSSTDSDKTQAVPKSTPSSLSSLFIIDMSAVSFCDAAGVAALESLTTELGDGGAEVRLACCAPQVVAAIVDSRSEVLDESKMYLNVVEAAKVLP